MAEVDCHHQCCDTSLKDSNNHLTDRCINGYTMLTRVKNTIPIGKQSNVVYPIPSSCGQVFIAETKQRLEARLKEYWDACEWGMTEKSAVAKPCVGKWPPHQLEGRHWCWTEPGDGGNYCWRRPCTFRWHMQKSASTGTEGWRSRVTGPHWWGDRKGGAILTNLSHPMMCILSFVLSFTFTLMITEVSSWNIGKVFFRSYISLYRRTLFSVYARANWEATLWVYHSVRPCALGISMRVGY